MKNKKVMEKLADWYSDKNDYIDDDKLMCPRCGLKLKYINYAEKYKLSSPILKNRGKKWECVNCGLHFSEN